MHIRKRVVTILTAAALLFAALPVSAFDGNGVEPWERSAETHRENLRLSIEYLENMDTSSYTVETVEALVSAIASAKALYADEALSGEEYWDERNALEYARAKLVKAETDADGTFAQSFRELSPSEVIAEMGAGINLGNTLDGHSSMMPSELAWQPLPVTKALIKSMHDAGYNTIRIPITWGKKIEHNKDTGAYTIDEKWLNRVNEIVDYALSQGMFTIINIHHDGVNWNSGWLNLGKNDIDAVMEKYEAVWRIIAERFKDYDEHLIFESMNEITSAQTDGKMWEGGSFSYDTDTIRNFNQLFVNTVRATGSNNLKRWLASKGHFACDGLIEMPIDPANEGVSHQMYAAHIYNSVEARYEGVSKLAKNYAALGCPLILGEWTTYTGDDGSTETGYNDVQKAFQSECVYKLAKINNICSIAWDIGVFEKSGRVEGGNASYWSRTDMKPGFQSVLRGVMRGAYNTLTEENKNGDLTNVFEQYGLDINQGVDQNPKTVTETRITEIIAEDTLEMNIGEIRTITPTVSPTNTNDLLVWTTDDDSIAAVSNGRIIAKGIGCVKITAYALNSIEYGYYGHYTDDPYANAVKKEITVTVNPIGAGSGIEGADSLEINLDATAVLDLKSDAPLYFKSENPEIAAVNAVGRVWGKKSGSTKLTAIAYDGTKKEIAVTVLEAEEEEDHNYVNLGIFVLYNDKEKGYFENEIGDILKISEDGTYTLSYDIATQQSEAAKEAGIETLNGLTAIYLKDTDAHDGKITESGIQSCKLKWEKIVVNGIDMPITEKGAKLFNPINASDVFDSGNPINAWEGSVVEGIEVNDFTTYFATIENPTKIEVTFTLSRIMFNDLPPKTYLRNLITTSKKLSAEDYTEAGFAPLAEAISAAETVLKAEKSKEHHYINAYWDLKAVVDALEPLIPPETIAEISETVPQSQNETPAEAETSDGSPVFVILIAAGGVIVAAAVIILLLKLRKKK